MGKNPIRLLKIMPIGWSSELPKDVPYILPKHDEKETLIIEGDKLNTILNNILEDMRYMPDILEIVHIPHPGTSLPLIKKIQNKNPNIALRYKI